jgi:hypothetical protein
VKATELAGSSGDLGRVQSGFGQEGHPDVFEVVRA